ncbi:MAG: glycoside hydrolase family 30 beta sandwich domain-containing protein [Candidatus Neomarinimicrobiota bacterium]|nr:glycoside hydrolase family 30 beta sandwich domain-containing protein [Candidatus Neomarinimicrobiota bacterium]
MNILTYVKKLIHILIVIIFYNCSTNNSKTENIINESCPYEDVTGTCCNLEDLNCEGFCYGIAECVDVDYYLTTPDKSNLLQKTQFGISHHLDTINYTIDINQNILFQEVKGFGFTLTGGSAFLLNNMESSVRGNLIQELFGDDSNSIGVSYLRISIGASDLDLTSFSYSDLPPGQTDIDLINFTLKNDLTNLIPVLNEIITVNPNIKIMASPWSAPPWMKTNKSFVGGKLLKKFYSTYANYFVKYIKGMDSYGIKIDAITIQNEPENPFNNPSMIMTANEQMIFIKDYLGPLFDLEKIETKILIYDHNLDNINYPTSILADDIANQYIDGTAFHLYAGDINNMSLIKNMYPSKNIYFTEQWIEAPGNFYSDINWHMKNIMIGAPRNWSVVVLQWNLAADQNNDPHTFGGCSNCLGAITIQGNEIKRNPAYYLIGHTSKFVKPNSLRIESSFSYNYPNVAYLTPDNKIVLIVYNNTELNANININLDREPVSIYIPSKSIGSLIWN